MPWWPPLQCILYTAICTQSLHTSNCTLYTAHFTLHTVYYTLLSATQSLHTSNCTVYIVQFTKYFKSCTKKLLMIRPSNSLSCALSFLHPNILRTQNTTLGWLQRLISTIVGRCLYYTALHCTRCWIISRAGVTSQCQVLGFRLQTLISPQIYEVRGLLGNFTWRVVCSLHSNAIHVEHENTGWWLIIKAGSYHGAEFL